MFDNQADPYQLHNLAGRPEQAALQAQLEALLAEKLRKSGDAFLPAGDYIRRWGYKVDANETAPYTP